MEDLIVKYLNETATDAEMETLLDWLNRSEDNQKQFVAYRDLWFASQIVNPGLKGEGEQAFRLFEEKMIAYENKKRRSVHLRRITTIAAAVALVIGSYISVFFIGQNSVAPATKEIHTIINQAIVGDGKGSVRLPDGTFVRLNSNSKLVFPEKFAPGCRRVQLEGEGYFDVKPDKSAPFYVETADLNVRVLGTRFDVRNYSENSSSETVLLSGKVEILMKANGDSVTLSPDQKLSFDKKTSEYNVKKVDAAAYTLWTSDKLVLDDVPLSEIFRKIGYWYNVDIRYGKDVPLNARYSLTIRNESKVEILQMLSIIARFKYREQEGRIIIYKESSMN